MKKHKHQFRFLETSEVHWNSKAVKIDKYICKICERIYCMDKKTNKRVTFDGGIGEEC